MTSYQPPANQPYSVHLHRNGQVEIVYGQSSKGSHASAPRHITPSSSPRSTAATFGSSHTRIASSTTRRESPPTTKHHVSESSTHHHHHHHRSSDPHRSSAPAHTSGHHHSSSGERHRHNSTSRLDKPSLPIPIPGQSHSHSHSRSHSHSHSNTPSPQGSPKQTRFSSLATVVHAPIVTSSGHLAPPLSHSYQAQQAPLTAVPSRSPKRSSATLAVPAASRHKPSSSADSFFFLNRPKGWYNRRGDRFVQKGVVEYQAKHLEWHPTFGGYPPPGEGWMDENGHFMPMGGGILKN